jgi:hypothetical protein
MGKKSNVTGLLSLISLVESDGGRVGTAMDPSMPAASAMSSRGAKIVGRAGWFL